MNQQVTHDALEALFIETGQAHHEAFSETDGADPDWPLWYARKMRKPLKRLLGRKFTKSRLVYCLIKADEEHRAVAPEEDWAGFYAQRFLECFGDSEAPTSDQLALYYYPTCPFCIRVLRAARKLDVDIELRNTVTEPRYRDELFEARGRGTVPVLRIESPDGTVRWMPESLDIIEYLERTYGGRAAA